MSICKICIDLTNIPKQNDISLLFDSIQRNFMVCNTQHMYMMLHRIRRADVTLLRSEAERSVHNTTVVQKKSRLDQRNLYSLLIRKRTYGALTCAPVIVT